MVTVLQEEKKIHQQIETLIDKDRIISFSDAVFAFAATLLVLKIEFPEIDPANIDAEFLRTFTVLIPQYIANIISFLVIGYYWLSHHALFGMIKRLNFTIVWLNIVFLIFLSFLPFPIDLFGDYMHSKSIVVFYSASLAVVGFILLIMWIYASYKNRLLDKNLPKHAVKYYSVRYLIAPLVFTLSIPIVYIHPILAQFSWLLVIVGILLAIRAFNVTTLSEIEKESI